jgi:hypothetical protein
MYVKNKFIFPELFAHFLLNVCQNTGGIYKPRCQEMR